MEPQQLERLFGQAVQSIHRLAAERDSLFRRVMQLTAEIQAAQSAVAPTTEQTNNSSQSCVLSDKLLELAELNSKYRRSQRELEEKLETVAELKEALQQSQQTCSRLRSEHLELQQEARAAKALRDEIDVLNERVRRVDRLESESQKYRDRISDLEYYKSRFDEMREEQRLLAESKALLEEQLEAQRKRAERVAELDAQVLQLRAQLKELELQRDIDKDKCASLVESVSQLRVEKQAALEESSSLRRELEHLRQLESQQRNAAQQPGNLFDQLQGDATKRVLRLELENQVRPFT